MATDYSNRQQHSTTEEAKAKAQDAAQEAKLQAQQVSQQVKAQAREAGEQAQQQANRAVDQRTSQAAQQLDPIVNALHQTGDDLGQQNQQLGQYAHQAAAQVEQVQQYLRGANLDQVMRDARDLARSQPELFVGAAFTAGLLLARFLKSSGQPNYGYSNRQFQPPANYQYYRPSQSYGNVQRPASGYAGERYSEPYRDTQTRRNFGESDTQSQMGPAGQNQPRTPDSERR